MCAPLDTSQLIILGHPVVFKCFYRWLFQNKE